MRLTTFHLNLPLAHEFTIARGSIRTQPSLIVELEHDGVYGFGEVTENEFYGHNFDSMESSLRKASAMLDDYVGESPLQLWECLMQIVEGDTFAASALDMAAHDLRGKLLGIPTWNDWGLEWKHVPESSYTIGIDTIDTMISKLKEMSDWSIYKIKLGTPHDIEIVTELRRCTDARFRVDANCGWTAKQTIEYSRVLKDLDVEFIEQPLPKEATRSEKLDVFENSAIPIIADEDCQTIDDIEKCFGLFHGVNIKICKCGGLSPALQMLHHARRLGMKTMVGCMVESSIGISGAAQLLPLLDFADLDGAVLLRDEPAVGVKIQHGKVTMPSEFGCGGELDRKRLDKFLIGN
jgi:L-alanine-DL-glutamate epimerase-like enolase superfamily enzyme